MLCGACLGGVGSVTVAWCLWRALRSLVRRLLRRSARACATPGSPHVTLIHALPCPCLQIADEAEAALDLTMGESGGEEEDKAAPPPAAAQTGDAVVVPNQSGAGAATATAAAQGQEEKKDGDGENAAAAAGTSGAPVAVVAVPAVAAQPNQTAAGGSQVSAMPPPPPPPAPVAAGPGSSTQPTAQPTMSATAAKQPVVAPPPAPSVADAFMQHIQAAVGLVDAPPPGSDLASAISVIKTGAGAVMSHLQQQSVEEARRRLVEEKERVGQEIIQLRYMNRQLQQAVSGGVAPPRVAATLGCVGRWVGL